MSVHGHQEKGKAAAHLAGSRRTSKRRKRCAKVRYISQYARLRDTSMNITASAETLILALTLCQDSYAVPLRTLLSSSLRISIQAGATCQEETRVPVRKSLPRMTQKERSGSRLPAYRIRYGLKIAGREIRTPPGILVPEITAPDGGTTRGRPAGVGTAMRSVSLTTAVYSFKSFSNPDRV